MESFRVIAANIPDKVWRANNKGEVEYCNDEWLRYTGATFEELKDHNWLRYLHRNDAQKVLQLLKREEGNERSFQTECRIKRHSGKYIWHLMRCEAIFNDEGKISAWLALMMDINEQKRNAMALEQVVESRTMELQKANTELIRSNNDLEQFAYVASHDLAEPIRMISSFTDLLEKRLKDHGDPDVHDFMKYISEGADRMKLLVRDLLDYSRVGRKNTNWHVVDCNEMMEIVTSYLQEKINKSGAEIQYSDLPTVRVMGSAMLQLLQNFISNSLKFSHAGRKPAIKVSADKVDGFWHFQVQDNGIGIDEKYNDRVFIIFQRLHTRDEYSGMGIGLAICKKIVDLHGGNIWYESEPGEGTIFHFTLPVETLQKKGKTEEEEEEE